MLFVACGVWYAAMMARTTWAQHWSTAVITLETAALPVVFVALLRGALSGWTPLTSAVTATGEFVAQVHSSTVLGCRVALVALGM